MPTGRRIAIIFAWSIAALSVYLSITSGLPQSVILLVFLGSFLPYMLWLRLEPYFTAPQTSEPEARNSTGGDGDASSKCKRCDRVIVVDPALSRDVFEGMHWLCFHLEFEHDGDPDVPCSDVSCPQWRLEVYENRLRELGEKPEEVVARAVEARFL